MLQGGKLEYFILEIKGNCLLKKWHPHRVHIESLSQELVFGCLLPLVCDLQSTPWHFLPVWTIRLHFNFFIFLVLPHAEGRKLWRRVKEELLITFHASHFSESCIQWDCVICTSTNQLISSTYKAPCTTLWKLQQSDGCLYRWLAGGWPLLPVKHGQWEVRWGR